MDYQGVFENKFAPSYMRNHKAVTVKNLRCFPRCGPEHKDNGFCGNEVVVRWNTNGRTQPSDYQTFSEFQEADSATRYAVNQIVSERDLHGVSTLMRGEVHEENPNNGTVNFSRESKGWHYGWMAGRGNGSHAMHEMRVYLFERIDPLNMVCRLVVRSPQFQVTSRKRIRPKKSQQGQSTGAGDDAKRKRARKTDDDDYESDEDDEDEDEKPKKKKTPAKKDQPKRPLGKDQNMEIANATGPAKVPHTASLPLAAPPPMPPTRTDMKPPTSSFPAPRRPPVFMGDNPRPSDMGHGNLGSQQPGQFSVPPRPAQQQQQQYSHMPHHHSYSIPPPPFQNQRPQHQSSIPSNPQQAASQASMYGMAPPQQQQQQPQQQQQHQQQQQQQQQHRTGGISWPYAISSTPPIYHPALTPPIYQHLSTTPPIFLPMMLGNETPSVYQGLPSFAAPEGNAEDVLAALWNPTPPSAYPSVIQLQKQHQMYLQHKDDKKDRQPR